MFSLAIDVQKIIMEFLHPEEIKALYETCNDSKVMFEELTKHTNLIIDCKRCISDEELIWFESKNIRLKLWETNEIFSSGDQYWFKNGLLHRDNDLPAIIYPSGNQYWYKNGEHHRDNDLPAVIYNDGTQYWWKDGKQHRDNDLPAVIQNNGDQYWFKNGRFHRDNDLPAIIQNNGDQYWYKNGKKYNP